MVQGRASGLCTFHEPRRLHNLVALVQHLPETSAATLAVGAAMLLILLGLERYLAG